MAGQLQDLDLSCHPFNIYIFDDLVLLQDLDSDFFTGHVVSSKFDLSESAFTYGLADQVVANAFGFVLFLLFPGLVAGLSVMSVFALLSRLLHFIN